MLGEIDFLDTQVFVPFSTPMMPHRGLSYVFPVVPPSNFAFSFNLPPARLMPSGNPVVPKLSN